MSYSTHGGFNKGSPIQKPVEVGKQYEVDVTEISRKGDGIVKIQGFVIFVENGKVGNKIKVEKVCNKWDIRVIEGPHIRKTCIMVSLPDNEITKWVCVDYNKVIDRAELFIPFNAFSLAGFSLRRELRNF